MFENDKRKTTSFNKINVTLKKEVMNAFNRTLVLDVAYLARSIITTERAFVISFKGNAEVIHEHDETFGLVNPELEIKKPSVIRVKKYVNDKLHRVPLTRENVYRRELDEWSSLNALAGRYRDWETDRKSTRLNSSHSGESRMPSSA